MSRTNRTPPASLTIVIACCLAAALGGCGKKPAPTVEVRKPNVEIMLVEPTLMVNRLTVRASVEPWTTVQLSAEVAGRLESIAREEGDAVEAGLTLFSIDQTSYQARVDEAAARAGYQRAYAERCETLFKDKSISKDQWDKAVADREEAEATLESARAELAKTLVASPIGGLLDDRQAEVGEFVAPGTPLGVVVDTSRVKVIVPVPEKDIVYVHPGDTMAVAFDALGGEQREGKVIFIKQVGNSRTLTFPVHLEVDNRDGRIRPPMIARVDLVRERVDDAIAVPLFAAIPDVVGYHVFVEVDGVARRRDVRLSFPDGDFWRVVGDLRGGDRLIVRGQRTLSDGDAVRVVSQGQAPAGATAGGRAADGTATHPPEARAE